MSDQRAALDEELGEVENEVVHILITIGVLANEDEVGGYGSGIRLDLTRLAEGLADLVPRERGKIR